MLFWLPVPFANASKNVVRGLSKDGPGNAFVLSREDRPVHMMASTQKAKKARFGTGGIC